MSKILLVFGEGGHAVQMERLLEHLAIEREQMLAWVDRPGVGMKVCDREVVSMALRSKHSNSIVRYIKAILNNSMLLLSVMRKNDIRVLISTGPGVCILPALLMRAFRGKVVFIETWSRFKTRSFTGRVMYHLAHVFYVQNEELLELYPRAVYSGRL